MEQKQKGNRAPEKVFFVCFFFTIFLFLLLLPYCSGPLTFYLRAAAASASATNGVFAAAAAAADFVRFGAGQLCFLHLQSSFFVQNSIFCLSQFYVSLFEAFLLSQFVCLFALVFG